MSSTSSDRGHSSIVAASTCGPLGTVAAGSSSGVMITSNEGCAVTVSRRPLRFWSTRRAPTFCGGAPGAFDRLLGSRLGAAATEQLALGRPGVLVGLLGGTIVPTPLAEVVAHRKRLDLGLLDLARVLAR